MNQPHSLRSFATRMSASVTRRSSSHWRTLSEPSHVDWLANIWSGDQRWTPSAAVDVPAWSLPRRGTEPRRRSIPTEPPLWPTSSVAWPLGLPDARSSPSTDEFTQPLAQGPTVGPEQLPTKNSSAGSLSGQVRSGHDLGRVRAGGLQPPTSLVTDQFRLEPLGPQHNEADHAAWTSSIEHIRSTPGYADGRWPPHAGMTIEENLADLRRHADDFARGTGFTFTVLDPATTTSSGASTCIPRPPTTWDVTVHSWVRADSRASTCRSRTRSQNGSPPTGRGSAWTAAVAEPRPAPLSPDSPVTAPG